MAEDPASSIEVEDEVLQVLFWLQGEGVQREVSVSTLTRLLRFERDEIAAALDTLAGKGQLEMAGRAPEVVVSLSESGRREGSRRFREEFEPYLGHDSHLVCDDPACDCHSPDATGGCTRVERLH